MSNITAGAGPVGPLPTTAEILAAIEKARTEIAAAESRHGRTLDDMTVQIGLREWTAAERKQRDTIVEERNLLRRTYGELGLAAAQSLNDSAIAKQLHDKLKKTGEDLKAQKKKLEALASGLSKAAKALEILGQLVGMLAKVAAIA